MSTGSRQRTAGLPPGLARLPDDRVVAGVCAGVARWLGVDPLVVRLATVILTLANGVGAVAYVVAWLVLPEATDGAGPGGAPPGDAGGRGGIGSRGAGLDGRRSAELAVAICCITLGTLVLVRWAVPYFPDQLVWPAAIAAVGAGIVLTRASEADRARWAEAFARFPGNPVEVLRGGRAMWLRLVVGTALLVSGFGLFLVTNEAFSAIGQVGTAILATALGLAVVFAPWIVRLARQVGDERRERIRTEERAEMAAHLHDSVLQTLALIQRHADEPDASRSLARRQERELRAWLYDERSRAEANGGETLSLALDRMTDEVEADHRGVTVNVVLVGDCPVDPGVDALAKAVREAVVNAAKHSGAPEVSVYAEVADGRVEAFVRDRGRGFDPASVDGDRQGIAQSIVRRMDRHGGEAHVASAPGDGTEVMVAVACQTEEAS
jgi:signal transduction histidine kinase/phage shock protein PspC (stress-responsive transcriptional regulator)